MINYFVSYLGKDSQGISIKGHCQVSRLSCIVSTDDLENIANAIKESSGHQEVIIMYWRRFEQPE